jgi:uncharacterized protein (DUF1330 family)
MSKSYINVSDEAGKHFFSKQHSEPVVMLNMLRFKKKADYSDFPLLAPSNEISGLQAYKIYMKCVSLLLSKIGSELIFSGKSDQFLIGPSEENWDAVILVKHLDMKDFLAFASDQEYLAISGHRTAALADSRLLPLVEGSLF